MASLIFIINVSTDLFFQCCTLLCWNFNSFATEILYPVSYNLNEEKHSNKGFINNRPDSTRNYVTIMIIKTCLNFLGQNYTESSSLSVGTFVGKKKNHFENSDFSVYPVI